MSYEPILEEIGLRIQKLRESREVSFHQLASHLRPLFDNLEDLEHGHIAWEHCDQISLSIGIEAYIKIAKYFNISLDYLILGKEEIDLDYSDAYAILKENGYDVAAYSGCLESKEIIWIASGILREKEKRLRTNSATLHERSE